MIVSDFVTAVVVWALFFCIRKVVIEHQSISLNDILKDKNIIIGSLSVGLFWLIFSALFGEYDDLYKKSRLKTLKHTFLITLGGTLILFFVLLLDDRIYVYTDYYKLLFLLFFINFLSLSLVRILSITIGKNRLYKGEVSMNTLLIGDGDKVNKLVRYYTNNRAQPGYKFIGYMGKENPELPIPHLGLWKDRHEILSTIYFEECFVAFEQPKDKEILRAIHDLDNADKVIKIVPDNYHIIAGAVRMDNIYSELLIEIDNKIIKPWQWALKRIFDIFLAFFAIIITSPLLVICFFKIVKENHGPIFYKQQRIGLKGKPFTLYKFRSMYVNAEDGIPRLAEDNDVRITPWGSVMRKYRLDELPQMYNVLKGEMSWVGPRPERQYFIDKIVEKAPQYNFLHKVKPGITSWGMVRYGYASTIEEMIDRMQFDILYIENYSLTLDIAILFQTFLTILRGEGK